MRRGEQGWRRGRLAVGLAVLFSASTAAAQSTDGGANPAVASLPFGPMSAAQAFRLMWVVAIQQQLQLAQGAPTKPEGAAPAIDYFTNGAEATAVPTTGPGAAYFQNGAYVFAATPAAGQGESRGPAGRPLAPNGTSAPGAPGGAPGGAGAPNGGFARGGADAGSTSPSPSNAALAFSPASGITESTGGDGGLPPAPTFRMLGGNDNEVAFEPRTAFGAAPQVSLTGTTPPTPTASPSPSAGSAGPTAGANHLAPALGIAAPQAKGAAPGGPSAPEAPFSTPFPVRLGAVLCGAVFVAIFALAARRPGGSSST